MKSPIVMITSVLMMLPPSGSAFHAPVVALSLVMVFRFFDLFSFRQYSSTALRMESRITRTPSCFRFAFPGGLQVQEPLLDPVPVGQGPDADDAPVDDEGRDAHDPVFRNFGRVRHVGEIAGDL